MDQHLFSPMDELINDLNIEIASIKSLNAELIETLDELTDLMEDTVDGSYKPDSFTARPARCLLNRIKDNKAIIEKEIQRMKELEHQKNCDQCRPLFGWTTDNDIGIVPFG